MEVLVAYTPAIIAIVLAVILRLRRSHKEASKKIASLREELDVLRDRNRQLEQDLGEALDELASPSFHEDPRHHRAARSFADHAQIEEAFQRLEAMKANLPFDPNVDGKYIAELDGVVESLEQATGTDLSRWLGIPPSDEQQRSTFPGREPRGARKRVRPCDRSLFRFKILSLQAFCNYQTHHSQ